MKFSLTKSAALPTLTQALETCNAGGGKGKADTDFLVQVDGGKLLVTSVNDHAQQTVEVPVKDLEGENESFTVTGKSLTDFLRQCMDEDIVCQFNPQKYALKLEAANRNMKYVFATGRSDEFSPITYQKGKKTFNLDGAVLSGAFGNTHGATAKDAAYRPYTAVKLVVDGGAILAEATDQNRAALYEAEVSDTGVERTEFLVPREVAKALSNILNKVGSVTIRPCGRHLAFEWEGTTFVAALEAVESDNEFVSLAEFFGGAELASCRISKDDFLRSLRLAGLLDDDPGVTLSISAEGLEVRTEESEAGAGVDVLRVAEHTDEATSFLALKSILKAVEACEEPWIVLKWVELENQEVSMAVVDGNGSLRQLVFPVRSKDAEVETEE